MTELSYANMFKIAKIRKNYLFNLARYSIHLKHLKHILMQKSTLLRAEMTVILQNEWGAARAKKEGQPELSFFFQ